jgi:hypothetical protein
MLKRIADRLVAVYCVLFAILFVVLPAAYRRHNADWYAHMGFLVGLILSAIIILWEVIL